VFIWRTHLRLSAMTTGQKLSLTRKDVTPTDYYGRMSPSVRVVLVLLGAWSPDTTRALPIFGIVHARASGDSLEGWPSKYSPLPLASLRRVPVSDTVDSATWFRWWLPPTLSRSLRFPAWRRDNIQVNPSLPPDCWITTSPVGPFLGPT
jgi:hypothetical protein